ncbi:MAG TPA: SRPBCC family protein [Candidatus Limnocylindrales bacterium]|nr:SRPBCC family protein [Candidatus Limnocylindrales bacterium]
MGQVHETVHIDAPVDVAWAIGRDVNRIPEWNTTVASVKDATGPLDVVGASYTAVSKIVGRPLEVVWRVERVEPMRFGEAVATAPGGGSARTRVAYEPDGAGCRVTIDVDYELPGGFLGGVADKLFAERSMARDVRHSSENFKALVEQEAAVAAPR